MGNKPTLVSSFINAAYIEATRDQRRFEAMTERCKVCGKKETQRDYGIDFEQQAVALLRHLNTMGENWTAVRVRDGGWEVVQPYSQEAIVHACKTNPAPSLAAQDGLVELLQRIRDCCLNGKDPSGLLYSSAWIVSQLNALLPEIDAAIKGDKS